MNKKTFDLIIKIILSVLAIASGILAFILRWPSYSAVEAAIFGIAYFIAAISFCFADKKYWVRVVMIVALMVTIFFTLDQALSGMPLGIGQINSALYSLLMVLLASPAILAFFCFASASCLAKSLVLAIKISESTRPSFFISASIRF